MNTMTIHPVAPLTDANRRYYEDLHAAKELLKEAATVEDRITLINVIGESTSQIWRLKRREDTK